MVNPINGQSYPDYSQSVRKPTSVGGSDQHFSLNPDSYTGSAAPEEQSEKEGVVYEHSTASGAYSGQSAYSPGSSDSGNSSEADSSAVSLSESIKPLLAKAKELFGRLSESIRTLFGAIWESKSFSETLKEVAAHEPEPPESLSEPPASLSEAPAQETPLLEDIEKARDARIREALKSGDKEAFRSRISNEGRIVPARNTSILTYYDSHGRLIEPSASDRQRILHGDRGSQKR